MKGNSSNWVKVSSVAMRVQRQTGTPIPVRGYAAWEIAGYLLKNHDSSLLENERRLFGELVFHCDNCAVDPCSLRHEKLTRDTPARCWVFKPKGEG